MKGDEYSATVHGVVVLDPVRVEPAPSGTVAPGRPADPRRCIRSALLAGRNLDRLPRGLVPDRLLRGEFGDWIARPWLDRAAFGSLAWYFPLSRLWAAASVADGDAKRFGEEVPLKRGRPAGWLLERALAGVAEATARYGRVERIWRQTYFSNVRRAPSRLVRAELERRTAARIWMASRGLLAPFLSQLDVVPVRWEIPAIDALAGELAAALTDPDAFYRSPQRPPDVQRSHRVPGPVGMESWIRFASPGYATNDTAWAKIFEPDQPAADIATVILCHGLAVETEMWGTSTGIPHRLVRRGLRVIAPEAPWHNRRAVPGRWGGEPLIATAPRGAFDLFEAALGEIAVLIAWARGQGSTRVALGGTSLGALTSQLAATRAHGWPTPMRPDFLYLVATSASMQQVAVDSELAKTFGLAHALAAAGWTDEQLSRLSPLTDPLGEPVMAPERIIMVLGRADTVTQFEQGRQLAERWRVPADNLFIRDQGHFSAAVGAIHDDAPLVRLKRLIDEAG